MDDIKHQDDLEKNEIGQSALFDMSLFELEKNQFNQAVNIEFKAHNVEQTHIAKDFLKLICEEPHSLFFHVLKAADSGTLYRENDTDGWEIIQFNQVLPKQLGNELGNINGKKRCN